uniref:Uncharacterized protein n=1 Tax=viral metagenome TaxID=1070528 RepID=A0A6C0ASD9_9ZZZZ
MATYIDNNKPFYIEGTITPANRSAVVRLKQDEKSTGYMQVTPESEPGVIANSLIQTPYAGTEYIDEAPLKGNAEPTFMLENKINALVTEKARIFSLVNMDKATKAAKISEIDDQIRGLKLKINYRSGSAGFDNVVKYANIPGPTPNIVSGTLGATTDAVSGTLGAATDAVSGATNAATGAVTGTLGATTDAVSGTLGAATDAVSGALGATTDAVSDTLGAATGTLNAATGAATGATNAVTGAATGLATGATNAATDAVSSVLGATTGAVTGLANGFSNLFAPRPTEAELKNGLAGINKNSTRGGTRRRRKHHKNKTNHRVKRRTTNKMFKMFGFGRRRRTKHAK